MVDEMVSLLGTEQGDDDNKKVYCENNIDATEDQEKALERDISDFDAAIEERKAFIEQTAEELAALAAGIKALDAAVTEATEQRQAEHKEFDSTMASNNAAKELLKIAKNRLQKFYNPSLYRAPPKRELSREDRIVVNMGGTAPPTEAPGGIAGTGVEAFAQVAVHNQRST